MNAPSRHARVAMASSTLALAMILMSFAAVPLYSLFCRATGYGGATQVSAAAPAALGARNTTVRFDANVGGGLGWTFRPAQPEISARDGDVVTATYVLRNEGATETTAVAAFNVTPELAGSYFNKLQCFCFTEQTLKPGETREETVVFYVDPAIERDRDTADIGTITLSYTFFPVKTASGPLASRATGAVQR